MKKFQKVAAMLLGLTMSVSLFACGGSGDDSSKENGPDNILGIELPGNLEEGEGKQYLDGAVEAFKAANTVTIEYTMDYSYSITENSPYVAEAETETMSMNLTVKATLAKTEAGYNVSIDVNATGSEDGELYTEELKLAYIDGFVYNSDFNYDEDEGVWEEIAWADLVNPDTTLPTYNYDLITAFLTGELNNVDFSSIYDILGPVVEALAFIENNEYKFNLDMKQDVTTALQTLANIDWTQSVEAFINNALKECGSDKTVKSILDEIAAYGAKTVGEVYQEFNKALKDETGKDLNGLKNDLVAKFKNIDFAAFENHILFSEVLAVINQIEAMDIDELIKPYEAMTIDELLPLVTGSPTTFKAITDMIYESLSTMTLEGALYSMNMIELRQFAQQAKYITVDDLSEKLSVKFQGYKFSSMNFQAKIGGKYDNTSDTTAGVKTVASVAGEMSCKVYFDEVVTVITPPVMTE